MAAPKGNQYAVGHGRPQEYDREAIAARLDVWSQRDDARWIGDFAIDEDLPCPTYFARFASESEVFAKSLKKAKLRIAGRLRKQLHDKENPYNYGLFMREISMYDRYLREHDKEVVEHEAEAKANAAAKIAAATQLASPDYLAMIAAMTGIQARSIDDKSKSAEQKS